MRTLPLVIVVSCFSLTLVGCGKKEEPVTVENPPLVAEPGSEGNNDSEESVIDPKFLTTVKGAVFFLTDEERKQIGMSEEEAEQSLMEMPEDELRTQLETVRSTKKGDLKMAAAYLLATTPSDREAYKQILLDVPADFQRENQTYEQAYEAWGYMAADFYRQTEDAEVLTALFTHDFDGAGAETVFANRNDLALEMPESVLPKLNDVQLNNLGRYMEVASADLEADGDKWIQLSKSPNKNVAAAAEKVLAAFEAQQNSNEIESRVP